MNLIYFAAVTILVIIAVVYPLYVVDFIEKVQKDNENELPIVILPRYRYEWAKTPLNGKEKEES